MNDEEWHGHWRQCAGARAIDPVAKIVLICLCSDANPKSGIYRASYDQLRGWTCASIYANIAKVIDTLAATGCAEVITQDESGITFQVWSAESCCPEHQSMGQMLPFASTVAIKTGDIDTAIVIERDATAKVKELAQELAFQAERCGAWSWGNEYGDGLLMIIQKAFDRYDFDMFGYYNRKPKRAPLSQSQRDAIYERDGRRCRWCGTEQDLSIDHIHPVSLGGSNEPSNLQVLCRSCNSWKGSRAE